MELAISALKSALEVFIDKQFYVLQARAQNNLGLAYARRILGVSSDNMSMAIQAFKNAIELTPFKQLPEQFLGASFNLGGLFHKEKRWLEAKETYQAALIALNQIRGETVNEESRHHLAQQNEYIYQDIIHCCLEMEDYSSAVNYALLSKGLALSELVAGEKKPIDQILEQDTALAEEWGFVKDLKCKLDILRGEATADEHIDSLQKEINKRTNELLFRFPALLSVQPLPPLTITQAQTLSEQLGGTPLVEYFKHSGGWGAFVIMPDMFKYVALGRALGGIPFIDDLALIMLDLFWEDEQYYTSRLKYMYALLIAPLKPYLPTNGSLVLAPENIMHLAPFQALVSEQGTYLCEDYALSLIPSIATLRVLFEQQRVQPKERDATTQRLLSIAYTGEGEDKLENVIPESAAVSTYFEKTTRLWERNAVLDRIFEAAKQPYEVVHISCHGHFDADNSLNSALHLALNTQLSINDIRMRMRLQGYPLVTISACQTGMTQPRQSGGANGFSWAFLAAGASAVVSSQWSVPDETTKVLFSAFYQFRRQDNTSDAEALQQAIQHVRHNYPEYYSQPYYWAAFQVTGLPKLYASPN